MKWLVKGFVRLVVRLKTSIGVTCVLFSIERNHSNRKLLISGKSMMRMTTAERSKHGLISPSLLTEQSLVKALLILHSSHRRKRVRVFKLL